VTALVLEDFCVLEMNAFLSWQPVCTASAAFLRNNATDTRTLLSMKINQPRNRAGVLEKAADGKFRVAAFISSESTKKKMQRILKLRVVLQHAADRRPLITSAYTQTVRPPQQARCQQHLDRQPRQLRCVQARSV